MEVGGRENIIFFVVVIVKKKPHRVSMVKAQLSSFSSIVFQNYIQVCTVTPPSSQLYLFFTFFPTHGISVFLIAFS